MLWVILAISAYFFLAASVFVDRFLMKGPLKSPLVYAFYAGVLNGVAIFLFLLNFLFHFVEPISLLTLLIGTFTGMLAVWTLLVWFILVSKEEVSRASPVVGALQPIFLVAISLVFFREQAFPPFKEVSAFFFFFIGSLIIMRGARKSIVLKNHKALFILSAFYFSLSGVMLKVLFLSTNFWTGIILLGMGSLLGAGTLLFFTETRRGLVKRGVPIQKGLLLPFAVGRVAGFFGSIFQLLAINFANITQVPLIGALTGFQFLFLYLLLFFFMRRFPEMEEEMTGKALLKKLGGAIIIGLGFLALAI